MSSCVRVKGVKAKIVSDYFSIYINTMCRYLVSEIASLSIRFRLFEINMSMRDVKEMIQPYFFELIF